MSTKKLLPTSTAGSLPEPSWLAEPETLWSPWKLQDDALTEGKQDALRLSLQEQQHAGIDIVSDGEQTRQHFVTTFIEHLSGVDFESAKPSVSATATMPACPRWLARSAARSRCSWRMRSSSGGRPRSRSSGPCPAR